VVDGSGNDDGYDISAIAIAIAILIIAMAVTRNDAKRKHSVTHGASRR
jgi:hypothetical protein